MIGTSVMKELINKEVFGIGKHSPIGALQKTPYEKFSKATRKSLCRSPLFNKVYAYYLNSRSSAQMFFGCFISEMFESNSWRCFTSFTLAQDIIII